MGVDKQCGKLAARQYGLLTRSQALKAGMSRAGIGRRVATGRWERILPQVYRVAGAPDGWHQRLKAVCLWAGPGAAISHHTAAALHGLDGFRPGPLIEVTTHRRLKAPGIIVHQVREPQSVQTTDIKGIRVTTATRTLMTLGTENDTVHVENALDECLRRGLSDLPRVRAVLRKHGGPGRRGAGTLSRILRRREHEDAKTDSALEDRLLKLIRRSGLPKPVVHYEAYTEDEWLGEVDFAYPERRIAIEVDSHKHHSDRADWERDLNRRNRFTSCGWQVLHVTAADLRTRPDEVTRWIRQARHSQTG